MPDNVTTAATLIRDNLDLRANHAAAVSAVMRVTGLPRHDADDAVRQAQARLDREDANDWRRWQANARAGRPIFDGDPE